MSPVWSSALPLAVASMVATWLRAPGVAVWTSRLEELAGTGGGDRRIAWLDGCECSASTA